MKQILLGSMAFAAMLAGPAMAADMPVKAPPPPPVFYDWSGAYIGFNIGVMSYDVDRTFVNRFPIALGGGILPSFSTEDSDGIFGFHAGVQGQWGSFVLGVEAALSACFDECRAVSGVLPAPFPVNVAGEHKITNLFTVGPRLGFAWDRFLLFATGGAASANLKATYCNAALGLCGPAPAVLPQHGQSWNWGWYAGAGFEYMIHKGALVDVIIGAEYQHWEVDTDRAFTCLVPGVAVGTCGPLPSFRDYDLGASGDLVRARLTIKTQGWRFWGPPPAAPVAAGF